MNLNYAKQNKDDLAVYLKLQDRYMSFHIALLGHKPYSKEKLSLDQLNAEMDSLNAHYFRLESTAAGRKQLASAGWNVTV